MNESGEYQPSAAADSGETVDPEDVCAELSEEAILPNDPCDDVWQLHDRLPVPYYGCTLAADDTSTVSRQVYDLGVECEDPYLDGFWLFGDLMAREGGPIVSSKVDLDDKGRPVC